MHLGDVLIKGNLKKDDKGELFVIVGNEEDENESWEKYFQVYEWRRGDFHLINRFFRELCGRTNTTCEYNSG